MKKYYIDRPNYFLKALPALIGFVAGVLIIWRLFAQSSGNVTNSFVVTSSILIIFCMIIFIVSFPSLPEIFIHTLFTDQGIIIHNRHNLLTYFKYNLKFFDWRQIKSLDISNYISVNSAGEVPVMNSDMFVAILFKDDSDVAKKLESVGTSKDIVKFLRAIEPALAQHQIGLTMKHPGAAILNFIADPNSWQTLPGAPKIVVEPITSQNIRLCK